MKSIRSTLAGLALAAAVVVPLTACGHGRGGAGYMQFSSGSISLKNGAVLVKSRDHGKARVESDGSLQVGGEPVKLTPQGQAALARYNATALAFTDQALNLGMESADFALHTIGEVFNGLVNGNPDQAGKEADRGGWALEQKAKALCARMDQWRQAQDAAALAVPEFRPYAVIVTRDTQDCFVSSEEKARDAGPAAPT